MRVLYCPTVSACGEDFQVKIERGLREAITATSSAVTDPALLGWEDAVQGLFMNILLGTLARTGDSSLK